MEPQRDDSLGHVSSIDSQGTPRPLERDTQNRLRRRGSLLVSLAVILPLVAGFTAWVFLTPGTPPRGCLGYDLSLGNQTVSYWDLEYTWQSRNCVAQDMEGVRYLLRRQDNQVVLFGNVSDLTGANGITFINKALSPNTLDESDSFRISRLVAQPGYRFELYLRVYDASFTLPI